MNWRRGFWLWILLSTIWYGGFGVAGYISAPNKDWIYLASSTQPLAKIAPSEWSTNKPLGFGNNIIETRQGMKIAIPSSYAQRFRKASYLQRVDNAIWKQHRIKQIKDNWIIVIAPLVILIVGFSIRWGLRM